MTAGVCVCRNVYGVLPLNSAKRASITLMLIHQVIAFCLYSAPLYYMVEKVRCCLKGQAVLGSPGQQIL